MYRRRKSFFNFRDKSKSAPESSPEPTRRQISEPAPPSSSNECETPRRQVSEPIGHSWDYDSGENNITSDNRNDDNNNPWELRKDNDVDIQKVPPKEGRLLTILKTFGVKLCNLWLCDSLRGTSVPFWYPSYAQQMINFSCQFTQASLNWIFDSARNLTAHAALLLSRKDNNES